MDSYDSSVEGDNATYWMPTVFKPHRRRRRRRRRRTHLFFCDCCPTHYLTGRRAIEHICLCCFSGCFFSPKSWGTIVVSTWFGFWFSSGLSKVGPVILFLWHPTFECFPFQLGQASSTVDANWFTMLLCNMYYDTLVYFSGQCSHHQFDKCYYFKFYFPCHR